MRCPIDNEALVIAERNGIEIDYCPKCRGVWLDRGELDKIIERGSQPQTVQRTLNSEIPQELLGRKRHHDYDDDDDDYKYKKHHHSGYDKHHHYGHKKDYKHKAKSWLGDIFDF